MNYTLTAVTEAMLPELAAIEKSCFSSPISEEMLRYLLGNERQYLVAAVDQQGTVLGYAGMMTVLDGNGPALTEGWKAEPDIVKPNEKELSQLMGREISEAEILYAVEELAQKGQTVLLTLGEKGAMCAGDGNLYCVPAVKVDTVNPVGSGDTFLAAWLHARIQGMDGMESAQFACRMAAENAAMFPAARVGKTTA